MAPTPPRIPSHEEQFEQGATDLDQHISSEDPHEGNAINLGHGEVECGDEDCPTCG